MNRSKIDYLAHSEELIGRPGYAHNIITGCKHTCPWCFARRMVEHGRLKGSPAYPYGFEPTFHPERVRAFGGKPKLIFLNDMGDVGGDWWWKNAMGGEHSGITTHVLAAIIIKFAELNPQHIILLLTKNPSWYRIQEWPDNVWCGFSASSNEELDKRFTEYPDIDWVSLEPWLVDSAPYTHILRHLNWAAIGGLTGREKQGLSNQTKRFLSEYYDHLCPIFVKDNSGYEGIKREYPEEWKL